MAHHVEPMDIDSDFDNKENSLHHNNVLPFTEKGYEELDVSELNMKLRYSVTPASSPMSKSFTANCTDNRSLESGDDSLNVTVNENYNLSNSLNSTLTKNDNIIKSLKSLPLQAIPTEQFVDSNRNTSVLRPIDSAVTPDNANITVTVSGPSDIDENLSLPSSSSSALHTPEATTPTKDIPIKDGGSPIMRGLKSVLNMFRSSQSPIPPLDHEGIAKQEMLSPAEVPLPDQENKSQAVLASTPIASHRKKEMSPTKRNSPQKDSSIVFNDDLEKELQWKDETTILFSQERIPIHKLMLQHPHDNKNVCKDVSDNAKQDMQDLNSTVEYMDISYNESFKDRTITEIQVKNAKVDCTFGGESDSEFVDCETTFTKNKTPTIDDNDRTPIADQTQDLNLTEEIEGKNDSGSRLKQIVLDTTQDILDATLSVRPEDLLPEISEQRKNMLELVLNKTEVIDAPKQTIVCKDIQDGQSRSLQATEPIFNETVDLSNPLVLEANENESQNLNSTKSIEVAKPINQINEIFDAARFSLNEENNTENFNITRTVDNLLGVTQILDNNETKDLNCTKTIEETTTTQPINQTFDVTSIMAKEENKIENMNVTKTVENALGVTQILESNKSKDLNCTNNIEETTTINQTFDVASTLANEKNQKENYNVTKTENILEVTQILENSESQDFMATNTIDAITTATINETFNAVCSKIDEENQKENLDVTRTEENILGVTQILENQNSISEILDTQISNSTVVLDNNKNPDTKVISIPDANYATNDLNLDFQLKDCMDISAMPVIDPTPVEEAVIKPLPIPDDVDNVIQDVTMTELPVDIPLPDEDDLEKELILPVETTPQDTPPVSLSLDLVDDIKITTDINETTTTTIEGIEVKLNQNANNEVILPEVCALITSSKLESGDHVSNDVIESFITETVKNDLENVEKYIGENEMSELCKEIENTNLLPAIISTSNNVTKDNERVVDKEVEKSKTEETMVEINMKETDNNTIEKIDQDVIHKVNIVPMDTNVDVCESKPLPDIINQTIAICNAENFSDSLSVPEAIPSEKVEYNPELNANLASVPVTTALEIKEIEQHISNTSDMEHEAPIVKPDNIPEEKSSVTSSGDAALTIPDTADILMSEPVKDVSILKSIDAIPTDGNLSTGDGSDVKIPQQGIEQSSAKEVEEEIVLSENNSPFVSVIAETIPDKSESNTEIENIEDTFATKSKVIDTPPSSPPIRSKGYNFNFDDLDFDPFATKTTIRMSPPLDSPNKPADINTQEKILEKPVPKKDINRRKSQPERKRPTAASKRKFNATFDAKVSDKVIEKPVQKQEPDPAKDIQLDSPATIALSPNNVTIEEKDGQKSLMPPDTEHVNEPKVVAQDKTEKPIEIATDTSANSLDSNVNEIKPTSSSSDQSTYFSACTTSSESSIHSRNVFNIPEIDDANFNPFATKSKMRQSPPPDVDNDNPFATRIKIMTSPDSSMITVQQSEAKPILCDDKIETELMEKDASANLSDASKTTDERNVTTKEIHTEDEDTVEGPFLDNEDLNADEKMSDVDGENVDMMQFSELPPQSNEENLDNGEMFIDAEAFEFLLNQNKSNTVADSGKESLFLKFDPLFAKRMSAVSSDGVLASLAKLQNRQSTPTKTARITPPKNMPSPVAGPSNLNVTQDMEMNISEEFNDDLNVTVSKPMMVVPPAVNPVTPRNKSLTPNRSNRRSITFTSPAMAVIDRLLSLSSNNSLLHDTTVTQVSREQNEADIALSQLRELLAEKEISVYNLKCESNELKDRLNTLEGHVKSLEAESEDRLKKINQLTDTLVEKTKINKSMAAVVEEYERTIASLIAETAQDKKKHAEERMKLINERDEQTAHLASMEVSFSDLHSKYEKSKQVILNCKANEDVYRKSIKEFEENLTKMHNNYELLKQHATSKLNHANQELEKINRSHEAEVLKLNAMIKRKELHITSLEESLTQKTKANDELTAICDELINKVG